MAELRAAEKAFAEAAQLLLETLEARRGELPDAALAALEENIALIDESIDEVRRSLGSNGDRAMLAELGRTLGPDDAINIQFTSGTTGSPKAATLTHHIGKSNAGSW